MRGLTHHVISRSLDRFKDNIMSNNLNITQLTDVQNNNDVTVNDALGLLDAALTENLVSDFASGPVTLTNDEFRQNMAHVLENVAVARDFNIPTAVKHLFLVIGGATNTGTATVTLGTTTVGVAADDVKLMYTDGTANGLFVLSGGGGGGSTTFAALTDTPATLTGQAGKTVKVNAGSTALEFVTVSATSASVRSFAGAADTLLLTDAENIVRSTGAAAAAVTVPTNAAVAYPIGATVTLVQSGAGQITVAGAAGVVVNKPAALPLTLASQYSTAVLIKVLTNTWILTGDLG